MSTLVKNPLLSAVAAAALLAVGPASGFASDLSPTRASAASAPHDTRVVSLARRAFLRFTAACLAHDRSRIAQTVTDDVVLEYDFPHRGIILTVDTQALGGLCAASKAREATGQISNLLIFPMTDPKAVFVQYETSSHPDAPSGAKATEHMAIVELHGDRIAKIRDFTTTPGDIASIATGSAHNTIP